MPCHRSITSRRRRNALILLPLALAACGGGGDGPTPPDPVVPAEPAVLAIRRQPGGATAGATLSTQPVIEIRDRSGRLVSDATSAVTARLAAGAGALHGTTTVRAVGGLATFTDLAITGASGEQYSLSFSSPELAGAVSIPFRLSLVARSEVDRADDATGPQVHVIYVLPSDGTDRALDMDSTLAYSVSSFQRWLAMRTGGRAFRMDTFQGDLDVTFFRLSSTDAQMRAHGAKVVTEIERQLTEAGRIVPEKIYLAYYDGGSNYACGGAAWPPLVPGQVAAMYLRAEPNGGSCSAYSSLARSPDQDPGYWEFAALHDLIHTLGVVSVDAPHHTNSYPGHVPEPNDLMYGGPEPWQIEGASLVVDVGGDDYFGFSLKPGVSNLMTSPFLVQRPTTTALQESVPAPGHAPRSALPSRLPPHPSFDLLLQGRR